MKKKLTVLLLAGLLLAGCTEGTGQKDTETKQADTDVENVDNSDKKEQTGEKENADTNTQDTVDHKSLKPVIDRIYKYISDEFELSAEDVFYMVTQEGKQMQFEFRQSAPENQEQTNLIGIFDYDSETGLLETTNELGEKVVLEESLKLN